MGEALAQALQLGARAGQIPSPGLEQCRTGKRGAALRAGDRAVNRYRVGRAFRLFVDLAQLDSARIDVGAALFDDFLQQGFCLGALAALDQQQSAHIDEFAVVRIRGGERFEFLLRGIELLVGRQQAGIGFAGRRGLGRAGDESAQEDERLPCLAALLQQLGLEQSRGFPVAAKLQRLVQLDERCFVFASIECGVGAGEMRFRRFWIGGGQAIDAAADFSLVRVAGEDAVQVQQHRFGALPGAREQPGEQRFDLFELAHPSGEQAGQDLDCVLGVRGFRHPQPGRFERFVVAAGEQRDLGRAAGDARIARRSGQIQIVFDRQSQIATRSGDFGEKELLEDLRA